MVGGGLIEGLETQFSKDVRVGGQTCEANLMTNCDKNHPVRVSHQS